MEGLLAGAPPLVVPEVDRGRHWVQLAVGVDELACLLYGAFLRLGVVHQPRGAAHQRALDAPAGSPPACRINFAKKEETRQPALGPRPAPLEELDRPIEHLNTEIPTHAKPPCSVCTLGTNLTSLCFILTPTLCQNKNPPCNGRIFVSSKSFLVAGEPVPEVAPPTTPFRSTCRCRLRSFCRDTAYFR